jgi:O-antigen/teichoic acid export membrane protein
MNSASVKSESLTSRASWLTFAKTVGFVFSIALPLLVARRMDPEQVGVYKQVFLVVGTALNLLPLAFQMSAYYFLPREPDRQRETVLNILLILTLVGALGCYALYLYPSILTAVFYQPELLQYSRLIGVTILLWIIGAALETIPIANDEIRLATVFIISIQASRALVFVTAAAVYGTVRSLIYAAIIHGAIQTTVLIWYLQSRFPGFWHRFDWAMLRRQSSYAVPLGAAAVLYVMQSDLHNYFVSNRFAPGLFAVYSFGTLQLPLIGLIQEASNAVLITKVGVLEQQNETREIIFLTARAARKLAAVYFPVYAVLMVVGPEFIRFLFTNRYRDSWPIFAVNLTMLPVSILLLDPICRAHSTERFFLLRLRMGIIAVQALVLFFWALRLGLIGVISVVVATNITERVITSVHFGRLLGVIRKDLFLLRDVGKLAMAALTAALACATLRFFLIGAAPFVILAACGSLFALVYLVSIHLSRVPTSGEYEQIREALAHYVPHSWRYRLD